MSTRLDLRRARVVCVFTGHGLKDPDLPAKYAERPLQLPAELGIVERELFG